MSDSENELWWKDDDLPQRTSSAPPILEVQKHSLFAMGNNYAHFFNESGAPADIRTDGDYLHFYNSYNDPSKLPPPLEGTSFEFPSLPHEDLMGRFSPAFDSPGPHRRSFLFEGEVASPRFSRPIPKRFGSLSSFDESFPDQNDLIPDLSSDSESVSSSIDDISSLVSNFNLSSMANGPEKYGTNRHLWDGQMDSSGEVEFEENPPAPVKQQTKPATNGTLNLPPGLTVTSVEQSHGDAEISGDTQSQRRKEPKRGANPATIPCRYFAQGYCSRGERCTFSHDAEEAAENWPAPAQPKTRKPQKEPSAPKPEVTPPVSNNNTLAASHPGAGHRRRHSSGVTPSQSSTFTIGTTSLAGRCTSIDQIVGQIYPMCKDQHGCRFLQKKLDEKNKEVTEIIFNEVYPHFAELMTDPFGNYLCQKLLEHSTDKQRVLLIESVAGDLVRISQNMHGTRAVQKMIECLKNPDEIRLVTQGLRHSVVSLIKDLNGNHVIQRCLNHLTAKDNQFIYDAVAGHCVEVATHRHGCCVLQRCIDHASENQKLQLVNEITSNGLTLVKDPYGNYVVQYVLDLPYMNLIANLVLQFKGHLAELSTQKFSSNVVEKCLNVSDAGTQSWMIRELTESESLKMLIQDPFGNYVIQTAMNVSEPQQHAKLVEGIKPFLFALRNTPYGKRIQNKILKDAQAEQKRGGGNKQFHK